MKLSIPNLNFSEKFEKIVIQIDKFWAFLATQLLHFLVKIVLKTLQLQQLSEDQSLQGRVNNKNLL